MARSHILLHILKVREMLIFWSVVYRFPCVWFVLLSLSSAVGEV